LLGNDENHHGISKQQMKNVAVKRLRFSHHSFIKKLYDEGQCMLNLDHPHIVKIFGLCKHQTSLSLILELCPLGAMNLWLKSNKYDEMIRNKTIRHDD
jgi:serine/threonine protein kinase